MAGEPFSSACTFQHLSTFDSLWEVGSTDRSTVLYRCTIDVRTCVGPEQCACSERAERLERSEHVWPQIVRNIWPTLANHQSQIGKNQPEAPKVNMLKSGDVSFDFGFEWCLGSATGYVAKISPKSIQNRSTSAQNTKSQHVEIWGCQF